MTMNEQTTNTTAQDELLAVLPPVDDEAIVREKMIDAMTPGYQVEFDPDEAECAGAFVEDALSEQDALDGSVDLAEEFDGKPAFLDDEGPSADIPPFIITKNIRELFGWKPGESLKETFARKKAQEGGLP